MKLCLVCAAIVSVCWAATTSDSKAIQTSPSVLNSEYPRFFTRTVEATFLRPRSERIYMYKNGKITKLLENATSVAETASPTRYTYLGARDGIYRYNDTTEKVEKYGTLSDNIIKIIKENRTDDLYILTDDHTLYKVTEGGTKKMEIEEAKGALEIILDGNDNLFYLGEDYKPFVVTPNGVKKIQGVPTIPYPVHLIKAFTGVDGVEYAFLNIMFLLHSDGTSEMFEPTAEQMAQIEKDTPEFIVFVHS